MGLTSKSRQRETADNHLSCLQKPAALAPHRPRERTKEAESTTSNTRLNECFMFEVLTVEESIESSTVPYLIPTTLRKKKLLEGQGFSDM